MATETLSPADRRAYEANLRRAYLYQFFMNFQFWWPIWVVYLQDERGLSLTQITALDSVFWLIIVVAQVPAGAVADRDYYLSLLKQMKSADVVGIFDKAYKDYVFDVQTKPLSITQVPEMMERGFEIVSFSKHYNFVGIGLAWIVSSEDNINRWLKRSSQQNQGVEWYKQKAGAETLTSPTIKAEMQEYFRELKERRDIFVRGLRELGLEVEIPAATPYLWIKVPKGFDDEDFVLNTLIKKAHVAPMPGSYFGENGRGYMRVTLFLSIPEIEEALERIQKVKSW